MIKRHTPLSTIAAIAAGLVVSVASTGALAQAGGATPPSPAASLPNLPTSPAKKALVQKLLAIQQPGIENLARSLAEQPLADMRQPVLQAIDQRVPADQRDSTLNAIDADFKKYLDEAVPVVRDKAVQLAPSTLGTALETKMTEDELKQLLAFFESSANKKYGVIAPEAQNALVQKLVTDTRPTIEPKIRAVQQSVSQRLNAFPANGAAPAPAPAPATGLNGTSPAPAPAK